MPAVGGGQLAGDERQVALLHAAVLERQARRAVRGGVEREQHDARGVAVDPVHHVDAPTELALEPLLQAGLGRLAARRDHGHARGLVDGDERAIVVEDHDRRLGALGLRVSCRWPWQRRGRRGRSPLAPSAESGCR